MYSVLHVLTRGRHLSHSANAVSSENRKFFPPLSQLVPSFGVTSLNLWKSFKVLQAADNEDLVIVACSIFD